MTTNNEIYIKRITFKGDQIIEKKIILKKSLDSVFLNLTGKKDINTSLVEVDFSKAKDSQDKRKDYYENGFDLEIGGKKIHYVRYKRTASSSRNGSCLFIDKDFSENKNAEKWTNAGLLDNDETRKNVENNTIGFETYKALTLSSLDCDDAILKLNPKNILFVDDVVSSFEEHEAVFIRKKEDSKSQTHLFEMGDFVVEEDQGKKINNIIWDGESLLDKSAFNSIEIDGKKPYKDKGMLLLRNRFFKTCAFNTNISTWFENNGFNLSDKVDLKKINGYTEANTYGDIQMITTYSSLKYLKFYDKGHELKGIKDWIKLKNNDNFGIVKTDKKTPFDGGNTVRLNYQFFNTLMLNKSEVNELGNHYIKKLQELNNNYDSFIQFIHSYKNDENDNFDEKSVNSYINFYKYKNIPMIKLLNYNKGFSKTGLYKDYYKNFIESLRISGMKGKLLVSGTNATMLSNPLELLKHVVKQFDVDGEQPMYGNQIYCKHFEDMQMVVAARSPHILMGNLYFAYNHVDKDIDYYFNLTNEIVVVNSIRNNLMYRLQGCDFDSDFVLLTDDRTICDSFRATFVNDIYPHKKFLVPVDDIKIETSLEKIDISEIDNKLFKNKVGEITNLSQRVNSLFWDKYWNNRMPNGNLDNKIREQLGKLYYTNCILSILIGLEIDSAKKGYVIDSHSFTSKVKEELLNDNTLLPNFFRGFTNEGNDPLVIGEMVIEDESGYQIRIKQTSKDEDAIFKSTHDQLHHFNHNSKPLGKRNAKKLIDSNSFVLKVIVKKNKNKNDDITSIEGYATLVDTDNKAFILTNINELYQLNDKDYSDFYYVKCNKAIFKEKKEKYTHYDTPMDFLYEYIEEQSFDSIVQIENEISDFYSNTLINTPYDGKNYKKKADKIIESTKKIAIKMNAFYKESKVNKEKLLSEVEMELNVLKMSIFIANRLDIKTVKYLLKEINDSIGMNYQNVRLYHYLLLYIILDKLNKEGISQIFTK